MAAKLGFLTLISWYWYDEWWGKLRLVCVLAPCIFPDKPNDESVKDDRHHHKDRGDGKNCLEWITFTCQVGVVAIFCGDRQRITQFNFDDGESCERGCEDGRDSNNQQSQNCF